MPNLLTSLDTLLTRIIVVLSLMALVVLCSVGDDIEDDPGPDDDDDPEGDCMTFHQCYEGGSQWGYCLERAGHSGPHRCYKCGDEFY